MVHNSQRCIETCFQGAPTSKVVRKIFLFPIPDELSKHDIMRVVANIGYCITIKERHQVKRVKGSLVGFCYLLISLAQQQSKYGLYYYVYANLGILSQITINLRLS